MTTSTLPDGVAAALANPNAGVRITVQAGGMPWSALVWGDPADRPLLLIHGVTASAAVWWRVGPALAVTGRRVTAVDQAGHGRTGRWQGHHRFRDNAADLAGFIRAAGLDRPELQVIGHSWGAVSAAALPIAGIRPATLVVLPTVLMQITSPWNLSANVGPAVSIILPSDGLWRGAIYSLEPASVVLAGAAAGPQIAAFPFFADAPPAPIFVAWSVAWLVIVLAASAFIFDRSDL